MLSKLYAYTGAPFEEKRSSRFLMEISSEKTELCFSSYRWRRYEVRHNQNTDVQYYLLEPENTCIIDRNSFLTMINIEPRLSEFMNV